jgi:hypothetical protein
MAANPAEVLFQPLTIGSLTIQPIRAGADGGAPGECGWTPEPQTEAFLTERAAAGSA